MWNEASFLLSVRFSARRHKHQTGASSFLTTWENNCLSVQSSLPRSVMALGIIKWPCCKGCDMVKIFKYMKTFVRHYSLHNMDSDRKEVSKGLHFWFRQFSLNWVFIYIFSNRQLDLLKRLWKKVENSQKMSNAKSLSPRECSQINCQSGRHKNIPQSRRES